MQVPEPCISEEEADILTVFACQRLAHENDMIPILLTIMHSICRRRTISDSSASLMFNALSKDISVPQQRIDDRFLVYQIMQMLAEKKFSSLTRNTFEFLIHFFELIDGERDPRCLLLKFRLFSAITPRLELGHLADDAFECIAVYFPISYNAPANDPYAITREDLAQSLIPCFRSSKDFAKLFYELIGEKITSERHQSKIDCYTGIRDCASFFGPDQLKAYMSIFWTCIRTDCVKVDDSESDLKTAACDALTAIVTAMAGDDHVIDLLTEVEQDLRPALVKQDLNLRGSAMKLLLAASRTEKSFLFFEANSMPHLLTSLAFNASRINAIEVHDLLIQFYSEQMKEYAQGKELKNNARILSLCLTEEQEPELISRKLQLLLNVIRIKLLFSDVDEKRLHDYVDHYVTDQSASLHNLHSAIFAEMLHQEKMQINDKMMNMMETGDPVRLTVLFKDVTIPSQFCSEFLHAAIARAVEEKDEQSQNLLSLIASKVGAEQQLLADMALVMMTESHVTATCILVQHLDTEHASRFMKKLHKEVKEGITLKAFMDIMSSIRVPVSLSAWEKGDELGRWILSEEASVVNPLICCVAAKCDEDGIRDMLASFVQSPNELSSAAYLTKGLAWAGQPFSESLEIVLQSFQSETSEAAAEAMSRIHEPEPFLEYFPKSNFYHQRIFFSCLPKLTSLLQSSISDQQKSDVKKAILCQLKFLPKNVIKSDLKKIHSLIISSLSVSSDGHSVALDCLKHLLEDSSVSSLISSNLNSILKSLTILSSAGKLQDRMNALNCLSMIARMIPESSLLPHRKTVSKSLTECLKDKKRIVRYAAADAALKWILIGQPGNEVDD